ncbi:MXRA5 [Branchiostoma lanceolatum]|uniref:MXRA5 protein n=1 Tax=Branchiostoma lanceolatum TaxID=7740 RepID=A0A8J9YYH4_BRALA|nr:MXRA5 [Branchiostoma lanceolatum]
MAKTLPGVLMFLLVILKVSGTAEADCSSSCSSTSCTCNHLGLTSVPQDLPTTITNLDLGRNQIKNLSFPTPDITVILPSGLHATVESGGRVTVGVNGTITIRDITAADAGLYACIAASSVGSTNAILVVEVAFEELKIVRFERNDNNPLDQGKLLQLICEATGIPKPDITVILPSGLNVTVESVGRVTVDENGTVIIRDVNAEDEGLYACIAASPVSSTFDILVVGLPQISEVSVATPSNTTNTHHSTSIFAPPVSVASSPSKQPEPAPSFSLPVLLGAICGSVAGTVLIGGIILTTWCKRNNKTPPKGPDFSVVFNNTNITTTVITNTQTGHPQAMNESLNVRNPQHVPRPVSSQFEPYEDVEPPPSNPRLRGPRQPALRPPNRNNTPNDDLPPLPPPRIASASGTEDSLHHYQPLSNTRIEQSNGTPHHYQSLSNARNEGNDFIMAKTLPGVLMILLVILNVLGTAEANCSCTSPFCNCNNLSLTSVPQDLPTDITSLDLGTNQITTLSPPTPDITVTLPSELNVTVSSVGRVTIDVNGVITITNVTAADTGLYVCIADRVSVMDKQLPGVLMSVLVLLGTLAMAEADCSSSCSPTACDCGSLGLTSVPQDLPTTITELDLGHNGITTLSQSDFSRNFSMVKTLPGVLMFLLVILKVLGAAEADCSCTSSSCDCSSQGLTSVPQDLPTTITDLNLRSNQITALNQVSSSRLRSYKQSNKSSKHSCDKDGLTGKSAKTNSGVLMFLLVILKVLGTAEADCSSSCSSTSCTCNHLGLTGVPQDLPTTITDLDLEQNRITTLNQKCIMGKTLPGVLMFLLVILGIWGTAEADCSSSCSSAACDCSSLGLTSVPQDLPTNITELDLDQNPGTLIIVAIILTTRHKTGNNSSPKRPDHRIVFNNTSTTTVITSAHGQAEQMQSQSLLNPFQDPAASISDEYEPVEPCPDNSRPRRNALGRANGRDQYRPPLHPTPRSDGELLQVKVTVGARNDFCVSSGRRLLDRECIMDKRLPSVLMFLLVILKVLGTAEACSCSSTSCDCRNLGLTSVPQNLPTTITDASGIPAPDITAILPSGLIATVESVGRVTVGVNGTIVVRNGTIADAGLCLRPGELLQVKVTVGARTDFCVSSGRRLLPVFRLTGNSS